MKKKPSSLTKFRFRKNTSIGAADADDDSKFLYPTFIDTGDLGILRDVDDPQAIIFGRTGSGKTALIKLLKSYEENVINLEPANLALTYISNNGILQFFAEVGVNLDLFYGFLWRHIFTVELLRKRYNIYDKKTGKGALDSIKQLFPHNKTKQKAIEYLETWENSFWEETDIRVKEVTRKTGDELNKSIQGILKTSFPALNGGIELNAEMAKILTEEQKIEVKNRGQQVINKVQMAELARIINIFNEDIFEDPQKRFYITIDKLDETWISEKLRYPLIRALLETVALFNSKVFYVKIIVCIREDLFERVFKLSNPSGYQAEKYNSRKLHLQWLESDLVSIVESRVNYFLKDQYTSQDLTLSNLLPKYITKPETSLQYVLARTMMRPRDIIMFFNEAIRISEGKGTITKTSLLKAEEEYSNKRLEALRDEWRIDYPNLVSICLCFKKFPPAFQITPDLLKQFEERIYATMVEDNEQTYKTGELYKIFETYFNKNEATQMMLKAIEVLHKVGFIGIKAETFQGVYWSYLGQRVRNFDQDATFHIHPSFWRALGVTTTFQSNN